MKAIFYNAMTDAMKRESNRPYIISATAVDWSATEENKRTQIIGREYTIGDNENESQKYVILFDDFVANIDNTNELFAIQYFKDNKMPLSWLKFALRKGRYNEKISDVVELNEDGNIECIRHLAYTRNKLLCGIVYHDIMIDKDR